MNDPQLDELHLTDQLVFDCLAKKDIDTADLLDLVDKREALLALLLQRTKQEPALAQTLQWKDALARTQRIIGIMQRETGEIAQLLHKYHYGSKSLQQYKKFL